MTASQFIERGAQPAARGALVIVDDGFGWWPCASAVETGLAAGWETVTVLTPAASFGARLPPEGHVQLHGAATRSAARDPPPDHRGLDRRDVAHRAQRAVGKDRRRCPPISSWWSVSARARAWAHLVPPRARASK